MLTYVMDFLSFLLAILLGIYQYYKVYNGYQTGYIEATTKHSSRAIYQDENPNEFFFQMLLAFILGTIFLVGGSYFYFFD
ncbi:hypothetical protein ACFL35_19510 [Candidatus Riflebacteria bacterium]